MSAGYWGPVPVPRRLASKQARTGLGLRASLEVVGRLFEICTVASALPTERKLSFDVQVCCRSEALQPEAVSQPSGSWRATSQPWIQRGGYVFLLFCISVLLLSSRPLRSVRFRSLLPDVCQCCPRFASNSEVTEKVKTLSPYKTYVGVDSDRAVPAGYGASGHSSNAL